MLLLSLSSGEQNILAANIIISRVLKL